MSELQSALRTFSVATDLDIEEDVLVEPVPDPVPDPAPVPEPVPDPILVPHTTKPRLTTVGRTLVRARFLMALEEDPPGERKLTEVQKAAYVRWLDYHMAE